MTRIFRLSPAEYINEAGILKDLPNLLVEHQIEQPVILLDHTVEQVIKPFLPESFLNQAPKLYFEGNCTTNEIDRLVDNIAGQSWDGLIAFGGGQLMDTAKVVADRLKLFLINVPTLPSNCAAIATQSILYSETDHTMVGAWRMRSAVDMVLIEPKIHRQAPRGYLLSGIGDTLAKFYEIGLRLQDSENQQVPNQIGQTLLALCRDKMILTKPLEEYSESEFRDFLDTIFIVAASVDGFLGFRGGAVLAHAFYNAYTKVKKGYKLTHGEIVAFGILLQLQIEETKEDELAFLETYFGKIGLPLNLADLDLSSDNVEKIANLLVDPNNQRVQSIFPDLEVQRVREALESRR